MNDIIKLSINNIKYHGWKSFSIERNLESLSDIFSFEATDKDTQKSNAEWLLRAQEECILYFNDIPLITGYIDNVQVSLDSTTHSIPIKGRSRTSDLVDCMYNGTQKSFSTLNIKSLANKLAEPYNIKVVTYGDVDVTTAFPFTINSNDTVFKNLAKKARDNGVLLLTNAKGELVIANSGFEKCLDTLEIGKNIKKANVVYDYSNRFSEYIVQAQSLYKAGKGAWGTNVNISGKATDEGVKRKKVKIIKSKTPLTRIMAIDVAKWEAITRAANSQIVNVIVNGFTDSFGNIWEINKLIDVFIPQLYINPATEMLITGVNFMLNNSGLLTKLTLKRKDAYRAKPHRKKKVKAVSGLGWDKLTRK